MKEEGGVRKEMELVLNIVHVVRRHFGGMWDEFWMRVLLVAARALGLGRAFIFNSAGADESTPDAIHFAKSAEAYRRSINGAAAEGGGK